MKPAASVESRKIPLRTSGCTGTIGWKFKIRGLHEQAAQYQTGDSDQNTRGKNIGSEIEEIPRPTSGMNGKEPLEHVDQVDEKIKNKAVEDKRVQQLKPSAAF